MATNNRTARSTTVWVLPLDSGCNVCVQQVFALQSSRFAGEMSRRGVRFARSPRHADVVLLTGPLAAAAREPLRRVLAAVPDPRALVAVGNCAINGCVFLGGAQIIDTAAEELDVNVEIAGCPPAPEAILDAIVEAALLLAGESSAGESEGEPLDEDDTIGEQDEVEDDEHDGQEDDAQDNREGMDDSQHSTADDPASAGHETAADDTRGGV